MTIKKNEGRFTIQFNKENEEHKKVIDILNQRGRSKSQFIVAAILYYIDNYNITQTNFSKIDYNKLEELVEKILIKKGIIENNTTRETPSIDYTENNQILTNNVSDDLLNSVSSSLSQFGFK